MSIGWSRWGVLGIAGIATVGLLGGCGGYPASLHPSWETGHEQVLSKYQVSNQPTTWLYSVRFTSAARGFAVGDAGTLLATGNGGRHWRRRVLHAQGGLDEGLRSVAFNQAGTDGIIVGNSGTVWYSSDQGTTWQQASSGTENDLEAVTFTGKATAVAVGDNGTILKSDNGGASWTAESSGTSIDLRAVSFASPADGVAVGDHGVIAVTRDGGNSWSVSFTPVEAWLRTVFMVPGTGIGYASGTNPFVNGVPESAHPAPIFVTKNGGRTWSEETDGLGATQFGYVTSFYFTGPKTGYAASTDGSVYYTADGGKTWKTVFTQAKGTDYWLESVTVAPGGAVWVVGTPSTSGPGGYQTGVVTILKSTDGGKSWTSAGHLMRPGMATS